MTRTRTNEAGFTIYELLVVVVIIGILAAVAVPMFTGTSKKTKMNAETNAVITDIRTRQEQYNVEMGRYFNSVEPMGRPPANLNGGKGPWLVSGGTNYWAPLKLSLSLSEVACTYYTRGGAAGTFSAVRADEPYAHIPDTAPASQNWYVVVAVCDDNRNATAPEYLYYGTSWTSGITRMAY